jgi:hypothetical protein
MDVFHPNDTFQFEKLQLTHPNSIAGGSYLTRYSYHDSKLPLYIQTTKTQSKQGIVITGKKAHIDLLITTSESDADFIEWITNLEKRSIDLLYEKRHLWFTQELDRNDIENSFTSPIRAYKTGHFLIRVNLELNRNFTHIQPFSCKIFDENKKVAAVDYIKAEQSIISIIEFQGIKFTSRNFQIELLLRQVLVIPDLPLFDTCVIAAPTPPLAPVSILNGKQQMECLGMNEHEHEHEHEHEPVPEHEHEHEPEYEPEPETERDITIPIPVQTLKHFECTEVDIDFKNIPDIIDTNEPDFQITPVSESTAATAALTTTSISAPIFNGTTTAIKLKKHKDVIYEMYKVAKQKAQEAKKVAIRAYLEAKEIKAAYLLDDLDDYSSEDERDSSSS